MAWCWQPCWHAAGFQHMYQPGRRTLYALDSSAVSCRPGVSLHTHAVSHRQAIRAYTLLSRHQAPHDYLPEVPTVQLVVAPDLVLVQLVWSF